MDACSNDPDVVHRNQRPSDNGKRLKKGRSDAVYRGSLTSESKLANPSAEAPNGSAGAFPPPRQSTSPPYLVPSSPRPVDTPKHGKTRHCTLLLFLRKRMRLLNSFLRQPDLASTSTSVGITSASPEGPPIQRFQLNPGISSLPIQPQIQPSNREMSDWKVTEGYGRLRASAVRVGGLHLTAVRPDAFNMKNHQ